MDLKNEERNHLSKEISSLEPIISLVKELELKWHVSVY